jgi:hypothetical protein
LGSVLSLHLRNHRSNLLLFKREPNMKYILILSVLAASLGGCVLVPAGYDDERGGYHRDRGYDRSYGDSYRYDTRHLGN